MPNGECLSGWIFVSRDFDAIVFVSRFGVLDSTQLSWQTLADQHSFLAFKEEFALKEPIKVQDLNRYKIDADLKHVQKWLKDEQD